MKNYNEESDEGYFLEVDVQYLENLHNNHNDLPFLPERMKIEKAEELELVIYIRACYKIRYIYKNFKRSIKSWIRLEKITWNYYI